MKLREFCEYWELMEAIPAWPQATNLLKKI